MVFIYCYLERDNDDLLKFHWIILPSLKQKAPFLNRHPPASSILQSFEVKEDIRQKLNPRFYEVLFLILWTKSIV